MRGRRLRGAMLTAYLSGMLSIVAGSLLLAQPKLVLRGLHAVGNVSVNEPEA